MGCPSASPDIGGTLGLPIIKLALAVRCEAIQAHDFSRG
ncbi:hypothetical protein BN903_74 [Halorubrum sp. AJ67]|nr:hypothetical protein BN903_74 [Halorubrum sp. AJ67]